ncbi:MAG: hypothetical protein C0467_08205 [Planctomycetaceae bacterium]|nr:hypothetical protein [Planctomycetaceae bacterium]
MSKTAPTPNGADANPAPSPKQYPFLLPPVEPDEIGRVGHYRVLHLLGAGGMGMVFAAEDIALRRHVAIKVMHPELATESNGGWQRFLREARALGSVKHQNLVTVYQAFQDRGSVFLVMELLQGESLEAWIKRKQNPELSTILQISREIAAGLGALHADGLIHRDIKPANIWLEKRTGSGKRNADSAFQVKILDLGLVRSVDASDGLTATGMVMGTPAYMSLEQVRGLPLDHRTDLFSLGCVMYALCVGRAPFQAENPVAQAAALIRGTARPVHELNPAIPKPLSDLIMRLLAKDPAQRPASADEVIEQLATIRPASPNAVERREPPPEPVQPPAVTKKAAQATEPLRQPTRKLQAVVVPDEAEKTTRRTKAKTKKKQNRSFLKRHGLTILAVVWLIIAGVLVVSVVGRGDKKEPKPLDTTTPPKGSEKSSDAVFLSAFPAAKTVSGPSPPAPPGFDGTIKVNGRVSEHGIFMHPAPADRPSTRITYKLNKEFARFNAQVAFNDSAPPDAPAARFLVLLDGKNTWTSNPVPRNSAPQNCELDVKGVTELTLEVAPEGTERGVHAVWLEPRVTK